MLKKALSLLIIASLTISPSTLVLAGQTTTPARSGATAAPAEPDLGWPRGYSTPAGANLILYQPQIASWTGQSQMTAYAAVSYQAKGAKEAALGTLKIESNTRVAVEERLVNFSQFTIGEAHFSDSRKRSGGDGRQGHHERSTTGRAHHRARQGARGCRWESDCSQKRRWGKSRSAGDLLQRQAGGARQFRRQSHLESDRGQRSEICGEHELGRLRARHDEGVLPSRGQLVVDVLLRAWALHGGLTAAAELQQAARRRKLEGSEVRNPRKTTDGRADTDDIRQRACRRS